MRRFGLAILATALAAVPLLAAAADDVRSRIAAYRELGIASKNAKDELAKGSPNVMIVQMAAREIGNAAKAMPGWFPNGTGPQPGVKTRAKPEIWTKAGEFKAAQNVFVAQAAVFMKAAASGDMEAMRAEHRKLASTCTNCHNNFRNE